jgi:serine protease Do
MKIEQLKVSENKQRLRLMIVYTTLLVMLSVPIFDFAVRAEAQIEKGQKQVLFSPKVYRDGFANVVGPLLPAVVNVSIIKKVPTYDLSVSPGFPGGGPFLDEFLKHREFWRKNPQKRRVPVGVGSGFVIDSAGYIVTNAHVVREAEEVRVTLSDQTELKAKVLGTDKLSDLALLKVESSKPLPFVKWGDASKVRVGNWAIAVGNSLGLGGTLTVGVISYVGRSFAVGPSHVGGFFQTDAPINMGNSGGPLFSVQGKVIGVNIMIASPTGGNIGIGFAVPSDVARFVVRQLKEFGYVKRGYLGVRIQDINQDMAVSMSLTSPKGAIVGSVLPKGPAAKAGLKQGDLILSVNNYSVQNSVKVLQIVGELKIGSTVPVVVWRKNGKTGKYETLTFQVIVGAQKRETKADSSGSLSSKPAKQKGAVELAGLTLHQLNSVLRERYQLVSQEGIVVTGVNFDAPASEFFKEGDVIVQVDSQAVKNIKNCRRLIEEAQRAGRPSLLCLIKRQGNEFFVPWSLGDELK